jgi:hypothetical protein
MWTRERWIRLWGEDELTCWQRDALRDVAIPESSKEFLVTMGLPVSPGLGLSFDGRRGVPVLGTVPTLRQLSVDYEVPICLDEGLSGAVVAIESEWSTRFVNGSVERFAECLGFYAEYARAVDDASAGALVDEAERRARAADPAAFEDVEHWWPVIIEQMRDGLL